MSRRVSTVTINESGKYRMFYHRTEVASWEPLTRTLSFDNGGWATPTTKKRMNQFADDHGLPVHVYQEDFTWYAVVRGDWDNPIPFDGNSLTLELA